MRHIALITGAYGGLGRCFAAIHARYGGDLVLVGRKEALLASQCAALQKEYHIRAVYLVQDLARHEAADYIFSQCSTRYGDILYLINNAGFGGQGEFAARADIEDTQMMTVNMETPTRLCKLFLTGMIQRGKGNILNVSSIASRLPGPLQAVYFATKAYMTSFSNALWRETAHTGVGVTCLMPGILATGFTVRGHLERTALFAHGGAAPMEAAIAGYEGMRKGKRNVFCVHPKWLEYAIPYASLAPEKWLLDYVYEQQRNR